MTEEETKNLKIGDYICLVTDVSKGIPTEDSQVREPKKVTSVAYKGVCEGKGEYLGRHFVVFHHESYLIGGSNENASCYGGDVYYVVPNKEQRERWEKGIYYKEFIQGYTKIV